MVPKLDLKIGISGKRNINHNEKEAVRKSIETNIRTILKEHNATEFIGYSSLAIGADTIFADIVVNVFKMQLHIALPFPIEEYKNDFITNEDILKLNSFLGKTKEIEAVTTTLPTNTNERNEYYFNAGKFIVDNCNEVIFVWDELKPAGKGGTAEIIGYYSEKNNIVPVKYIATNPVTEDLLHMEIIKEYELSNNRAMQSRDDYKLIWKLAIILGWLAVGLFAANTAFHFEGLFNLIAVSVEFVLVIITFSLIIKAKRKDYHGKYLSYRLRAETLRIIKHYYHSNKEIKLSTFTLLNDKELSALVDKINQAINHSPYTSKWYTNYSIKSLIEDQKSYHENKVASIGSKFHLFERFNLTIAILFMLNLFVHLTNALLEFKYPDKHLTIYSHELTVFLSILLPATYAAFEGVIYFQEWAILKKYSLSAKQSLHESINELPVNIADTNDSICFDKQSVTLNLVSSIMLTDNRNWHLILEDKNNYHWVI
jgi:hypothetical protein